jgi:hypothetical protein
MLAPGWMQNQCLTDKSPRGFRNGGEVEKNRVCDNHGDKIHLSANRVNRPSAAMVCFDNLLEPRFRPVISLAIVPASLL